MAKLDIKVGASVDRNLQQAYRPIVEAAKKAAQAMQTEQTRAARSAEKEAKRTAAEVAKQAKETAREVEKQKKAEARAAERAEKDKQREAEKAAENMRRIRERSATMAGQYAAREANKEIAERRRAAREMQRMVREVQFEQNMNVRRTGRGAAGYATGLATRGVRSAFGLASAVARSSGADLSLESILHKNAELETIATDLSNASLNYDSPRNATRVDPRDLMQQAMKTGGETGTSPSEILQGLREFTSISGDLATGRDVMKDLLILSKATGSSFEDMAAAAGNVAANLPDTADKGEKIKSVMSTIAGQGKLGAVEVKDLAVQMAKLASSSQQFTGKTEDTIKTFGAMVQVARAQGGAASATQAATSIAAFTSMLQTPKRAKEFEKATGISVFDPTTHQLRNPQTIITDALKAVGNDPLKMKQIFMNVQGARALQGFSNIYQKAGGGQAGIDAVNAEFERFRAAAISQEEASESFKRSLMTSKSQAEVFNAKMQETVAILDGSLKEAFIELSPHILAASREAANFTNFILGGDKGSKLLTENTRGSVPAIIASLDKQTGGGVVSSATEAEAKEAERRAFEAKARAQAELEAARARKGGGTSATRMGLTSAVASALFGPAGAFMNLGAGAADTLSRTSPAERKADVEARQKDVNDMTTLFQQIHEKNAQVADLLQRGIVVRVSNIQELQNNPPGSAGNQPGRQPTPEDKAAER